MRPIRSPYLIIGILLLGISIAHGKGKPIVGLLAVSSDRIWPVMDR